MNRKHLLLMAILTMIFFVSGCSKINKLVNPGSKNTTPTTPMSNYNKPTKTITPVITPAAQNDTIKNQISKMTLNEKIGQMVISGVDGTVLSDNTIKLIKNYNVGGFIILGANVKSTNQLLALVNSLKAANSSSKIPLFLSIDQEGGRIDRMPSEFKSFPTNKAIGGINSSSFSYKVGALLAYEVNCFGFNMDFAPVLDINSNPENTVIGDRSFGPSPDVVTALGIQTMKGIRSKNIIPVVKHFPGHGDTSVDSHIGLPLVNNDMNRLKSFELLPFTQAIKNSADAVMVAHILLPKIDDQNPSSMSKIIITDLLRNDLSFGGVIITDDMTMGAITKNYNIGDAAVKSLNAGSDIILVCHVYENEIAVLSALKKAVLNGTISEDRVNESVYRILKLKQKYLLTDNKIESVDVKTINTKISNLLNTYVK